MSFQPPVDAQTEAALAAKRIAKQMDQAFEAGARLAGGDAPPNTFYQEFLAQAVEGVAAPAGALWLLNPQGFLQMQCQVNLEQVGLDNQPNGRQTHNELLRQAFQGGRPALLEPGATLGGEGLPAGNPSQFTILLVPIVIDDKQVVGLLELWQDPRWDAKTQRSFLTYLVQMGSYVAAYMRNQQARPQLDREQLWTRLETFARNVHASLNATEVAYQVANEGRRLIGCDRVSVAIRPHRKAVIEAVSGADVVEKRSTLVRLMRELSDAVIAWGEKLVYRGTKDDTLPPDVLYALDEYLAESNSKLLVVVPLMDERDKAKVERDKGKKHPARSALIVEAFETTESPEPMLARLDVIANHAASALYNAVEVKRIPLGWLWRPVFHVQEGLGGKTKAIVYAVAAGVIALILSLILIPYPLKLDAQGPLVTKERVNIYPIREGRIERFPVEPGAEVSAGHPLVEMFDPELQRKLDEGMRNIESARRAMDSLKRQLELPGTSQADRIKLQGDIAKQQVELNAQFDRQQTLQKLYNCDPRKPGYFRLVAPAFTLTDRHDRDPRWTVLNTDYRPNLTGKAVSLNDPTPLLRLGYKEGPWEIELGVPSKHYGQLMKAFARLPADAELDVDVLLTSMPTRTFKGKLSRNNLSRVAEPNRDDHNETDPVVRAYVRLSGDDIPEEDRIPRDQLISGVEVHTKVRCGTHAMGYSLFYGVWEFLYEKVIFFV